MYLARKIYFLLSSQLGIDPRRIINFFRGLLPYLFDLIKFRSKYKGPLEFLPCLHDRYEESGATKSDYFWQDLIIARNIYHHRPQRHVDIGSRVDGFVAHVASFREIEVLDIRPITTNIPGVIFRQADLMNSSELFTNYCDSLSCLHALEHFGLGRYGDSVDPQGYDSGIRNMSRILKPGGIFYLSVPVGIERVEFNAHRVFNPKTIISVASKYQLELSKFNLYTADKGIEETDASDETLSTIAQSRYGLGIFTFNKKL